MEYPGFIGQAYRSQSISAAGDLLINLYPEVIESKGATSITYYGCPGTAMRYTLPTAPVRGIIALDSDVFAVGGRVLYRLRADGTFKRCGGATLLPLGTAPVSMQTDGKTVVIAVAGQLWVWAAATDVLAQIDPTIVAGAGHVSYSDGYYLVNVPGTAQFNISALFDGTSWDALDFGVKSGFPDKVVGHILDHRELWLWGSQTAEVWWNSGAANFPWERIQGPFVESGLGAALSLAQLDNTFFWLSQSKRGARMIWRANGYTPQRVSNFALEYAMSTYSRVDDAVAYTYEDRGHGYYVITFPSAVVPQAGAVWDQPGLAWDRGGVVWDGGATTQRRGVTWVFDTSNNTWAQRDFLEPQHGFSQQVRGWVHAYAFGMHLVGDYENGNIYEQSVDYYTDAYSPNGAQFVTPIRRLRRAPHLVKEHAWISYPGFELHIQQGVVPQSGPGSAPQFNLRKSKDGGFTWSDYLAAQAALTGEYNRRLVWRRLGQATDAVFEASSDEPIQHVWLNAYLTPDPKVNPR